MVIFMHKLPKKLIICAATILASQMSANTFAESRSFDLSGITPNSTSVIQTTSTPQKTNKRALNSSIQFTQPDWFFSVTKPNILLISSGGIDIPIQLQGQEYHLSNKKLGEFTFQGKTMQSVTRNKIQALIDESPVSRSSPAPQIAYRPTLFVSIHGATNPFEENGRDEWQTSLTANSDMGNIARDSQYSYFSVTWNDVFPTHSQAKDLARMISGFLENNNTAWDVVLIGHSRGGIFAHQTAQFLSQNKARYDTLHTVLLDATAATGLGDIYPFKEIPNTHGNALYDNLAFSNAGRVGTISDKPIDGYNNIQINYRQSSAGNSHAEFANDWVMSSSSDNSSLSGFINNLVSLKRRKDAGDIFFLENRTRAEIELVKISRDSIKSNLDGSCDNTSCTLQGNLQFGLGTVSLAGTVAYDAVDLAVSSGVGGASLSIQKDKAEILAADLISEHSIALSPGNASIKTSFWDGSVAIQHELGLSGVTTIVEFDGEKIDLSPKPSDFFLPGSRPFREALRRIF